MTLVARPMAAVAPVPSDSVAAGFVSSPHSHRGARAPRRPNTATLLARVIIGSLALCSSAQSKDQELDPTPCIAGQCGPGVPGGSGIDWPVPDWGSADTSYQPFESNPGDTQSTPNAAAPDCGKGDTSNPGSGNPIALATGNKIERELDFASTGEMGLYLERTYNHY